MMLRCPSRLLQRGLPLRRVPRLYFTQFRFRSTQDVVEPKMPSVVTISFDDLPTEIKGQETGLILNRESENRRNLLKELPPSLKAVRETMDLHKGYVVLTQIGSFYELYFEHAVEFSAKMNITLTKKNLKDFNVPMAGFPVSQLDRHLKVLVQDLNVGVAIVEQFKTDSITDNDPQKVTRRLTRIITPGTLIDEVFLNQQENNYLLSVDFPMNSFKREALPDIKIGLAWTDISVGSIFVQETTLEDFISTITRIKPSEILLDEKLLEKRLESGEWYSELVELKRFFKKYQSLPAKHQTMDSFYPMFESDTKSIETTIKQFSQKETAALRSLLQYIVYHLPESPINLQPPKREIPRNIMQIDSRTTDALELHKTYKEDSQRGSLISTIKKTVTSSGTRLLSQWISAPSTDVKEIKKRQALVTLFFKNTLFRINITSKLGETHDISRIVQRFALGRGDALELIYLARTINVLSDLQIIIREESEKTKSRKKILDAFLKRADDLERLSEIILNDLDEDALMANHRFLQEKIEMELSPESREKQNAQSNVSEVVHEHAFTVNPIASAGLKAAHENLNRLENTKSKMLEELQAIFVDELGYKSVELKFSPSMKYQVYLRSLSGSKHELVKERLPDITLTSGSSKSTRWMGYSKWTALGERIEFAKNRIEREEENVIRKLKKDVVLHSRDLREVASQLDLLDITSSFAELAHDRNLVCPEVDKSLDIDIINGRHLVVEEGLKNNLKNFTPNDFSAGENDLMWMITGPNMGGKSTFLRQNAIIVILAQIGSYVPAEYAKIGIVDKIFSRVGSADDLYNEMSTFMVEMVETSYILKSATPRSLAILDEVGRGTSGREGLAIAFATLSYMLEVNKCRGLFATHFGTELQKLLRDTQFVDNISFKQTKVTDVDDRLIFDHKLVDGISAKSYAINVAALAGYPEHALLAAERALEKLS